MIKMNKLLLLFILVLLISGCEYNSSFGTCRNFCFKDRYGCEYGRDFATDEDNECDSNLSIKEISERCFDKCAGDIKWITQTNKNYISKRTKSCLK